MCIYVYWHSPKTLLLHFTHISGFRPKALFIHFLSRVSGLDPKALCLHFMSRISGNNPKKLFLGFISHVHRLAPKALFLRFISQIYLGTIRNVMPSPIRVLPLVLHVSQLHNTHTDSSTTARPMVVMQGRPREPKDLRAEGREGRGPREPKALRAESPEGGRH